MKSYLYLILCSLLVSSELSSWIKDKTQLVENEQYLMTFDYSIREKKNLLSKNNYKKLEFYSITKDSSIIRLDNRITLCNSNYWETVDLNSKQRFLQNIDANFENIKEKILSIFLKNNYKIIKLKKNKYLLSMDDYFVNIHVKYENQSDSVSQIHINDSEKKITLKNFNIFPLDSIPYSETEWKDFQKFDVRIEK